MISLSSCESGSSTRKNPLLEQSWETPYGIAPFDEILPKDYMPALEIAISAQNQIIDTIVSDSTAVTFENTILPLDNSDIKIVDLFNIFTMVEASNSSPELAKVNSEMMPRLSVQQDAVLLNDRLFERVKEVYDRREELKLDREQLRLTERTYDKFIRGGALLSDESKARLAAINRSIAELRVKFSQNLIAENNAYALELTRQQLEGIPTHIRDIALTEAKNRGLNNRWVITLQPSLRIPFLTYSKRRELREEVYNAYINRGKNSNEYDNRDIIVEVTQLRTEKAQLLGYDNFAEYVTSAQMAGSPKAAYELLESVWTPALKMAISECNKLDSLMPKGKNSPKFEAWDWWYYTEEMREKRFSLSEEALSRYFTVEGVRNGAFLLANRLYGVTFRPTRVPQYGSNCVAYEVIDNDRTPLGILHLDLYTRPTKGQGAWCGFLREQRYEDGVRVNPIVSISCNFALPKEDSKTLLSMVEVETLFHEFGHALHFLFQDVNYRGLSEVEGDFVELPSQIMENWAFEPELLKLYAIHHADGSVIKDDIIKNIHSMRLFNQGFSTIEVLGSALLDMDLHTTTSIESFDVDSLEVQSLRDKRGLIEQISPRYYLPQFSHLFTFDYASGYYFYMWAEVLDKDAFETFRASGDIFNKELAARFRREILERGGSEEGRVMYRNFRGEEPSRDPLLISRGFMERPKSESELLAEELAAIEAAEMEATDEEVDTNDDKNKNNDENK